MSATLLDMIASSQLIILGMAAAGFSGDCSTLEGSGRGGIIDCGLLCGVVFNGGDVGGTSGIGSLGVGGGNGGCAAPALRLSGAWVVFPVPLFIVIGFGSVECFLLVPVCVDSE